MSDGDQAPPGGGGPAGRDGAFARLSPGALGLPFERLLTLALLAFALALVWGNAQVKARAGAPPDDALERLLSRAGKVQAQDPAAPVLRALLAWIGLGVVASVVVQGRLVARALRAPQEAVFPDDPLREPPPWGVMDFVLAFLGKWACDLAVFLVGQSAFHAGENAPGGAPGAKHGGPSLTASLLLGVVGNVLSTVVLVLIVRARRGTLRDLGIKAEGALREAGRGVVGYLAFVPLILAGTVASHWLCQRLGVPFEEHPLLRLIKSERSWTPVLALFVLAAVVAPISEELLFRGLLVRALRRPLASRLGAGILASFFFASVHPGLSSVLPIFLVGSLFASLFLTSTRGSLVGSIVAHCCFNAVNIAFEVGLVRAS